MKSDPHPVLRAPVLGGGGTILGKSAGPSLLAVLLSISMTACATLELRPSEGMARVEAFEDESLDLSRPHPGDDVSDAVSWVPVLDIIGGTGEVIWRNVDPRDTTYIETVYILEVDGRPVTPSAEGVEVEPGEHSFLVQYCLRETDLTSCSAKVGLTFVAEADTHYRLVRSIDFEVLVVDNRNDRPTIARADTTVAIAKDEKFCLSRWSVRAARKYRDDPLEKRRQLVAVKKDCKKIWRNAEPPTASGVR